MLPRSGRCAEVQCPHQALATALLAVAQADGAADWVLAPPGILTLVATGQLAFAWTRTHNCRATPRDAARRLVGAMAHPLNRPPLLESSTTLL